MSYPVEKCEIVSDFIRFQSDFSALKSKLSLTEIF